MCTIFGLWMSIILNKLLIVAASNHKLMPIPSISGLLNAVSSSYFSAYTLSSLSAKETVAYVFLVAFRKNISGHELNIAISSPVVFDYISIWSRSRLASMSSLSSL